MITHQYQYAVPTVFTGDKLDQAPSQVAEQGRGRADRRGRGGVCARPGSGGPVRPGGPRVGGGPCVGVREQAFARAAASTAWRRWRKTARRSSAPHGWGLRVWSVSRSSRPTTHRITHSEQACTVGNADQLSGHCFAWRIIFTLSDRSAAFFRAPPPRKCFCAARRHLCCPPQAKKIFRRRPGVRFLCGLWVAGRAHMRRSLPRDRW